MNTWYDVDNRSEKFEFKFNNGVIELDLKKEETKDNWTIYPHKHPCTVSTI